MASERKNLVAPNTSNTIAPPILNVEFVLSNYALPEELGAIVEDDYWSWSIERDEPGFLERLFPELRAAAETLGLASKITGHDSSKIRGVRDLDEFDTLLGAQISNYSTDYCEPAVLVPKDLEELTSPPANDFATQQYVYLFDLAGGGSVSQPIVLELLDATTWHATWPNGEKSRSNEKCYRVDSRLRQFVIALPFKLTNTAATTLHELLQNPNSQAQMASTRERNGTRTRSVGAFRSSRPSTWRYRPRGS
jgi:hypothetical protein